MSSRGTIWSSGAAAEKGVSRRAIGLLRALVRFLWDAFTLGRRRTARIRRDVLARLVRPRTIAAALSGGAAMLAFLVATSPPQSGPFGAADQRRLALILAHVLRPAPEDMRRLDVIVTGASAGRLDRADLARLSLLVVISTAGAAGPTSDGALGDLAPRTSVAFNTAEGTFRVDGGPWRGGGRLNAGPLFRNEPLRLQSICYFAFRSILMPAGVRVEAAGPYALGLIAQEDIRIAADLPLGGHAGHPGTMFTRQGGGGGGALLLAANHGRILLSGTLDVCGGPSPHDAPAGDGAAGPGGTPGGTGMEKWAKPTMHFRRFHPLPPGAACGGTGTGSGAMRAFRGTGGGGAFLFAAPGGVEIAGEVRAGTGAGAVYGPLRLTSHIDIPAAPGPNRPHRAGTQNTANLYPYAAWSDLPPQSIYLFGGGGSGNLAP